MPKYPDELDDDLPCPDCGQDVCVCDLDEEDENYYNEDEPEMEQEES